MFSVFLVMGRYCGRNKGTLHVVASHVTSVSHCMTVSGLLIMISTV